MKPLSYGQYIHGTLSSSFQLWRGKKLTYPIIPELPTPSDIPSYLRADRTAYSNQIVQLYEQVSRGNKVVKLEYPGGNKREVCRLHLESGESIIACQRSTHLRHELEEGILHHLSPHTNYIPKPLHTNSIVLFQEDCGVQRLSQKVDKTTDGELASILDEALSSIHEIHCIASKNSLDYYVPIIGGEKVWVERLIAMPLALAKLLNIRCKRPEINTLRDLLIPVRPRFIKWDTRLANATTNDTRGITWIDWEHSGSRNRLDDLAILLCDEGTPDNYEVEQWILEKYLPIFADGRTLSNALTYCRVFGVLHMTARLLLILERRKNEDKWWDKQVVIDNDYISLTKEHALRLSRRAKRWAESEPLIELWTDWFSEITKHIEADTAETDYD